MCLQSASTLPAASHTNCTRSAFGVPQSARNTEPSTFYTPLLVWHTIKVSLSRGAGFHLNAGRVYYRTCASCMFACVCGGGGWGMLDVGGGCTVFRARKPRVTWYACFSLSFSLFLLFHPTSFISCASRATRDQHKKNAINVSDAPTNTPGTRAVHGTNARACVCICRPAQSERNVFEDVWVRFCDCAMELALMADRRPNERCACVCVSVHRMNG